MAKNLVTWVQRQGLKVGSATPSYLPSLYNPVTWWPNLETMVVGGAKAIKNIANQTMNPWLLRQSEFFKHAGLQPQQLQILERNPRLIANILNDKTNWVSGVIGKSTKIPPRQLKNGRWTKGKTVTLTDDAKNMVNPLQKDLHAQLYFMQANLNRTGIQVQNTVATDVFNQIYGKNLSRAGANRLVGKGVLDDIIRFNKLDPEKLKYMEMNKHALNGLHRDMQFSRQFRNIAEITHGRKFKNKDEMASFLVSNGFEPGQIRKVGNHIMINYTPQSRSNFFTGGINARVLLKPSEPNKAYLVPNDVYDIFSSRFDDLITQPLGFSNQNLNLMGVKKIDIPDPSNWGKHFNKVNQKIKQKVQQDRNNIKRAVKKYDKPVKQDDITIAPENINRYTRLNKKQLEGNQRILDEYQKTPITKSRVAKVVAPWAGLGAGAAYITSDSEVQGEYDGTK